MCTPVASTSTRGAPFDLSHVLGFHVRHPKDAVAGGNGFRSSGWDLSSNKATLRLVCLVGTSFFS